jgi:hypothetical protein
VRWRAPPKGRLQIAATLIRGFDSGAIIRYPQIYRRPADGRVEGHRTRIRSLLQNFSKIGRREGTLLDVMTDGVGRRSAACLRS